MNRLLFLGALIYLVILLGVATLTGGILALVIPLLILLASGLLFGPIDTQLELEREISTDRAEAGNPVHVTLTLKNQGSRLEIVHLIDEPPSDLEILEGETELITKLRPGEEVALEYALRGRRGRYDFGRVQVLTMDLLGILGRRTVQEVPAPFELLVYPQVARVQRLQIRPRETKAYAGSIPARIGGSGISFFGVRTYQQGDDLRHINWRANARHPDTFYTNEFEQERVADVGIILDARQRTNVIVGEDSIFEHSIHAAATLAGSFLSDGNRVALLRYGGLLDWTVAGYGKFQLERILRALARAQLGDSMVFDKLENLPARYFPPKSQIVLVSPLASDDAELLPRLRWRGYQVLVISPDPLSYEYDRLSRSEAVDLARRIARAERGLLFNKLRQAGIQVIDWNVNKPLDRLLESSTAQMRPAPIVSVGL